MRGESALQETASDLSRLVMYSLSAPEVGRRRELEDQLIGSIATLRGNNSTTRVRLYHFEPLHIRTVRCLVKHNVETVFRGPHSELFTTRAWPEVLRLYPLLHRYHMLAAAAQEGWQQVLMLDCDTIFLADVARIFESYREADLYACPEAGSRRGSIAYDAAYLNENSFAELCEDVGSRPVPPFNCGAVLVNSSALRKMPVVIEAFMAFVEGLMLGIVGSEVQVERPELRALRKNYAAYCSDITVRSLPFPSSNHWIVDEVAFWLAVGKHDIQTGDFLESDVRLGGQVFGTARAHARWILGHYFSSNSETVKRWWRDQPVVASSLVGNSPLSDHQPLPVDSELIESRLMREMGGWAVYEDLFPRERLAALTAEALAGYWSAKEQRLRLGDGGEGRGGNPARRLVSGGGGDIQDALYRATDLTQLLQEVCGVQVRPTGERGSVNYYSREGDFIDLHLDVQECDLVVLSLLQDHSDDDDVGGSYRIYPDHIGRPLSSIDVESASEGETVKLRVGQSLVMYGGLVPHLVLPVRGDQMRVVSALCFRAGSSLGAPR